MRALPILFVLITTSICCEVFAQGSTSPSLADSAADSAELVVFGATPGGIVSAVAAKRSGRSVLLLEPSAELGGIIVGGLGASDTCNIKGIGSTAREFFIRVGKEYDSDVHWFVEPKVAKKVFQDMLRENELEVRYHKRLARVEKDGSRIRRLHFEDGTSYEGTVFIDASYEGDLLAKAGVDYIVGRESRDTYNESLAGGTVPTPARNFKVPVSAFAEDGSLLPGVHSASLPKLGAADNKVMSYNFRFCLTRDPENKVPIPKPKEYDRREFELLARYMKALPEVRLSDFIMGHHLKNGKLCTNRQGPFSTNLIGGAWEWPEASYAEREQIFERHKEYTLSWLHFMQEDPSVPKAVRDRMQEFGLCKDEFVDNGHFPHALYVREGRRMIGRYVLNQNDLIENRFKDDGVGLASCPIEVHAVQRVVTPEGNVLNEGAVGLRVKPYAIPYRSITPKQEQASNLLVPVAISASSIAYSSMRMEPVFMILGHSAGVAASMAIEQNIPVQEVDTGALRERLRSHKQVL